MSKQLKIKKDFSKKAWEITVFGVVQGVGFRPFIYRLAHSLGLKGWVQNIGFGVKIHLESENETELNTFLQKLKNNKPPLAQIEKLWSNKAIFSGHKDFTIKSSLQGESFAFISPDISVCSSCLKEMNSPDDRRYRYPFINCTDCGPRYTIVKGLPYDRPRTTMKDFIMCQKCLEEYTNPLNRRYHAQPIACPDCGPQVELIQAGTRINFEGGIQKTAELIRGGNIVAVKGLGGFHLTCDPFNIKAVKKLRQIKSRDRKPLALMARDIETIQKYAYISPIEEDFLRSARRPIVLLQKKIDIPGISPYLNEIGFMLPYTPLHFLLLEDIEIIVATSSNKKDAPIMKEEKEIDQLCQFILNHNRPIYMRADDSVMKIAGTKPLFLRRARGYVPYPQQVPDELKAREHVVALGGELKNTISLYKNGYIITSQFLGDLDEYRNYRYFEETLHHLTSLFDIHPQLFVSDLHPDFHTSRYAKKSGIPYLQVQHHFAHILAPLLEHKIFPEKKILGVTWDGYGFGQDGKAWGGEFLIANYSSYQRLASFSPVFLPGGDAAAKQPWRMAVSYLYSIYGDSIPELTSFKQVKQKDVQVLLQMLKKKINSPETSSCGRLFDAVSFLCGTSPLTVEFEGEAPMRLEAIADTKEKGIYPFSLNKESSPWRISFFPTIEAIVEEIKEGIPSSIISARFHNTLSRVILQLAYEAKKSFDIDTVALVGGVFLNKLLLLKTESILKKNGFNSLRPILYSPNDESLSLGQMAFALNYLIKKGINTIPG